MKKILITEDDPLIAEIYSSGFERSGFRVEVAHDGMSAIQKLGQQNPPDVVLLDLMLPEVNGVEVLKHIRGRDSTRTVPVIVLSNSFAGPLGDQAVKAGATKLFSKNAYTPRRLVEEVNCILHAGPVAEPEVAVSENGTTKPVSELRENVTATMPGRVAELRRSLQALTKAEHPARGETLLALYRTVHQIAGGATFAGFHDMAKLACAMEAMLKELHAKPEKVNQSTQRTLAQAVDVLGALAQSSSQPEEVATSPLILVVDDDPISRETTSTALERAHLRALNVDAPMVALRLAEENRFDLIFMDVQMPGMDGFEVCKKLHATGLNKKTPVVFVTSMNDFDTRTRSALSGGVDFIGKPILLIELAVKALTHLMKNSMRPIAAAA
jgi:CheY-like chemotaxis protein